MRIKTVSSGPGGLEVIDLEHALLELFGASSRWQHSAQTLRSPAKLRTAFKAAARRIQQRMDDITTADIRLLHAVQSDLDALRSAADTLPSNREALLSVAAALLHLVARLLGFDWHRGKPNREIVYFQSPVQTAYDDRRSHPKEDVVADVELTFSKRCELVMLLSGQGLRPAQIANIMRLPDKQVRGMIRYRRAARNAAVRIVRRAEGRYRTVRRPNSEELTDER